MRSLILLLSLIAPAYADSSPTCRQADVDFNGNVKIDWQCVDQRAQEFHNGNWTEEPTKAVILKALREGRAQ
jgi:hypothetical protein